MPRQIFVKAGFTQAYGKLVESEQRLVDHALQRFERYLQTNEAPVGLGVKHLGARTYEFRAGLSLRIVYVIEEKKIFLSLLGTHDEVRRYLRRQ